MNVIPIRRTPTPGFEHHKGYVRIRNGQCQRMGAFGWYNILPSVYKALLDQGLTDWDKPTEGSDED